MQTNMDKDTVCWLVKSGERISGPFTLRELEQKLRNSEIVVIDEIQAPLGHWHYVRDEELLAHVVQEARALSDDSRDDTEVGSWSKTSPSFNLHKAQNVDESVTESGKNYVTSGSSSPTSLPSARVAFESAAPSIVNRALVEAEDGEVQAQGLNENNFIETPVEPVRRGLRVSYITLVATIAVCAIFIWYNFLSPESPRGKAFKYDQELKQAKQDYEIGDFANALSQFNEIYLRGDRDPSFMLDYASASFHQAFSSNMSSSVSFQQGLLTEINPKNPAQWCRFFNIQGARALERAFAGEIQQFKAARIFFRDALDNNRNDLAARFNLLMTDFFLATRPPDLLKELRETAPDVDLLLSSLQALGVGAHATGRSMDRGIWSLTILMRAILVSKNPGLSLQIDNLIDELRQAGHTYQYYQELQFLKTAVQWQKSILQIPYAFSLGGEVAGRKGHSQARRENASISSTNNKKDNRQKMIEQIKTFLLQDTHLTGEYFAEPSVVTHPAQWASLSVSCLKVFSEDALPASMRSGIESWVKAVRLFCRHKLNEDPAILAREFEQLEMRYPKEPVFRILHAQLLMSRDVEQARALISDLNPAEPDHRIGFVMRHRLCMSHDLRCQEDVARWVGSSLPPLLPVLIGSIRYYVEQKDFETAAARLHIFYGKQPTGEQVDVLNYSPFLRLKLEAGERLGIQ